VYLIDLRCAVSCCKDMGLLHAGALHRVRRAALTTLAPTASAYIASVLHRLQSQQYGATWTWTCCRMHADTNWHMPATTFALCHQHYGCGGQAASTSAEPESLICLKGTPDVCQQPLQQSVSSFRLTTS
jgi:hypothetical protein